MTSIILRPGPVSITLIRTFLRMGQKWSMARRRSRKAAKCKSWRMIILNAGPRGVNLKRMISKGPKMWTCGRSTTTAFFAIRRAFPILRVFWCRKFREMSLLASTRHCRYGGTSWVLRKSKRGHSGYKMNVIPKMRYKEYILEAKGKKGCRSTWRREWMG